MNAVWEKIKADLFRHRIVSGLIVGTITVAAALLTLALSTLLNLGGPYDRLFAEMNGAHLWVFFKPGMVNTADLHRIQSLPGVIESTPRQYSYLTQARSSTTCARTARRGSTTGTPTNTRRCG